jgi:hypothetical protein
MKKRFELQEWHEYSGEWSVIASSNTSANKTLASYKTARGRMDYYSVESMKARGERLRMVEIDIVETIASITDL